MLSVISRTQNQDNCNYSSTKLFPLLIKLGLKTGFYWFVIYVKNNDIGTTCSIHTLYYTSTSVVGYWLRQSSPTPENEWRYNCVLQYSTCKGFVRRKVTTEKHMFISPRQISEC